MKKVGIYGFIRVEKAVFECLEDDQGEYDNLEDDFLLTANDGKPALVMDEEVKAEEEKEEEEEEYENKGVTFVEGDEMEERLKEMREKMCALLAKTDNEYQEKLKEQEKLDEDFSDFMEKEYADD